MLTNERILELALGLLKQESARDAQKKIGASDFSDPCEYHLASKLAGVRPEPSKYYLGAKIGTAVHSFLEDRIDDVDLDLFPEFASAAIEQKIVLGELDGYGTIKSTPDLVLLDDKHLVDWKTSSRSKVKSIKDSVFAMDNGLDINPEAMYTLKKYYAQTQVYAWGLNKNDTPIDACSLVFINRDGTQDSDVWAWTFKYDADFAKSIWERLERIWSEVSSGKDLEDFPRDLECFNCKTF